MATIEHRYLDLVSGRRRGITATLACGGLALVEPVYVTMMRLRNAAYDAGVFRSRDPGRPVVSIGNITTGGTGKTPVVHWLVDALRAAGHTPAVLTRGYKSRPDEAGDEPRMLSTLFNDAARPSVPVHADPDRVAGAAAVLRDRPDVDVFVLDDGFQHRRIRRDADLVLIDAAEPFGFDHVLPRGLLREPLGGLRRATALLLTRVDRAEPAQLARTVTILRQRCPATPIFQCSHALDGFRDCRTNENHAASALQGRRAFAFCGIGNPNSFFMLLANAGVTLVGTCPFADHHPYTATDYRDLMSAARSARADVVLTTQKDAVKLIPLHGANESDSLPLWESRLAIRFAGDDEQRLLQLVTNRLERHTVDVAMPRIR